MADDEKSYSHWIAASFLSLAIPFWMASLFGVFWLGLPALVLAIVQLVLDSNGRIGERTHWTLTATAWVSQLVPLAIGFASLNPIGSFIVWPAVALIVVAVGAVVAVCLRGR
jgi:hypothetical protein